MVSEASYSLWECSDFDECAIRKFDRFSGEGLIAIIRRGKTLLQFSCDNGAINKDLSGAVGQRCMYIYIYIRNRNLFVSISNVKCCIFLEIFYLTFSFIFRIEISVC